MRPPLTRLLSLLLALAAFAGWPAAALHAGAPAAAPAQASCQFVLGFATLRDLVGALLAGNCLEDQRFAANGDAVQQTTGGLLVWRKADNWTAFTNGHETWINGPYGLAHRLNTERFSWESDAAGFPAAMPPQPAAPVLAWYYPQFSQGLEADLRNAAAAGIDALVLSETGGPDLPSYLDAARRHGIRILLGVEPLMHGTPDAVAQRISQVLNSYGSHPAYLRYQGRPVFVFWNLPGVPRYPGQSAQQTWATIRQRADPGRASVWIGEGGDPNSTLSYLPAFDGLHLYSIAWDADPGRALSGWANRLRSYDPSKLWVATVMAGGYWGSGSDPSQWQYRHRQDGSYYRAAWRGAIATAPAMVIITSYNETAERTEIHPTGAWGTLYLDITRQMATAWRG